MSAYLSITDLHLAYGDTRVLNGTSFGLAEGEIIALTGASGCGKTSVLRCIAGLEKPQRGTIHCAGKSLIGLAPEHRNVGLIFQGNALFPHLSVAKNIGFGLRKLGKAEQEQRVNAMLTTLGLTNMGKRKPHELSGGQQQRVAIGRSLVTQPQVLLMDEPFSDLDKDTKEGLREEVSELLRASKISTIIVSHHADDVRSMAERVLVMEAGRVNSAG